MGHSSYKFLQPLAFARVQSPFAKGLLGSSTWPPSSVVTTRVFNFTLDLKLVVPLPLFSLPDWNPARALRFVMELLGANVAWHVCPPSLWRVSTIYSRFMFHLCYCILGSQFCFAGSAPVQSDCQTIANVLTESSTSITLDFCRVDSI